MEEQLAACLAEWQIAELATSADGRFLFVSDTLQAQVSALTDNGRITDRLGQFSAPGGGRPVVPFAMAVQGTTTPGSPALLLADYAAESLIVADFQPALQSFAVVAVVAIGLPILPGSVLAAGEDGVIRSPVLVAASRAQSTIVVGNRFSRRLLLLVRDGATIERSGTAELPLAPQQLAVSDDGERLLVLYPGQSAVSLLPLGPGGSAPQVSLGQTGSDAVREVQRTLSGLGYPIGAVDGVLGPRTIRSIQAINNARNLDLSTDDLERTARELRAMPIKPGPF